MIMSLAPFWGPILIALAFALILSWIRLLNQGRPVRQAVNRGLRETRRNFATHPGRCLADLPGVLMVLWVCGVGLFSFAAGLYMLFVGPKLAALKDLLGPFYPYFF